MEKLKIIRKFKLLSPIAVTVKGWGRDNICEPVKWTLDDGNLRAFCFVLKGYKKNKKNKAFLGSPTSVEEGDWRQR